MKSLSLSFYRVLTLIILLIGAMGSLNLMFNAGRNQKSVILVLLFTGWVISPFIALPILDLVSKRWPSLNSVTILGLSIILSAGSLLGYSGTFSVPGTKNAFVFLVVPGVSWLLLTSAVIIARYLQKEGK